MADESQLVNNNWWDSSRTTRFDESTQSPSSSAAPPNFGWPTEMVDNIKAATPLSLPPPSTIQESYSTTAPVGGGAVRDPNFQIIGLGLSSHGMDWNNNQPVFRSEKAENSSFRSMLQEGMTSNTYFHTQESTHDHWRQKLYAAAANNSEDSSVNDYKQLTQERGFSLEQPYTDPGAGATDFAVDVSATGYGNQAMFQQSGGYQTSYSSLNNPGEVMMHQNVSKFPQFLGRGSSSSPPEQQQHNTVGQLHFSNSTPYWNATAAAMNDVRSSFFPSLQTQSFDEKQKDTSEENRNSGATIKKSSSETSNKRPRNESPSPLPAFKVRKEKMGDRITALQQLVSPFGKTDTASVLSEAIEYIKFLHEQVNVLSTPYMRSGNFVQNQQQSCHDNKAQDPEAEKQDLRSRGLCLVPVSSTFPVTHETTVDFWTPTFGGTFR